MNVIKSLVVVAVVACSANVSAQIVYTPDFPVKKAAAAETVAHSVNASETAA